MTTFGCHGVFGREPAPWFPVCDSPGLRLQPRLCLPDRVTLFLSVRRSSLCYLRASLPPAPHHPSPSRPRPLARTHTAGAQMQRTHADKSVSRRAPGGRWKMIHRGICSASHHLERLLGRDTRLRQWPAAGLTSSPPPTPPLALKGQLRAVPCMQGGWEQEPRALRCPLPCSRRRRVGAAGL